MTPARFAFLISELGLTHAMAASALGLTDRQIRRYVAGDQKIPPPTGMLMEIAVEFGSFDHINAIYKRNNK